MRFLIFIALFVTAISCGNNSEELSKQEVLDNYEGEAHLSDVYIVDTTENMVKDTLPVIIETSKEIEN